MQSTEDPMVNAMFIIGIVIGAFLLILRLASIAWAFLLQVWQIIALFCAFLISTFCFVRGITTIFQKDFRCDIDPSDLEEEDDIMGGYMPQPEPEVQQEVPKKPEIEPVDIKKETESLLDTPLHLAANLQPEQRYLLEREGYLKKEFVPLGKTRRELYYIKEPKHEKIEHTFVVYAIVEKLKPYSKDITVGKPAISFFHKAKEYALAVETPHNLRDAHLRAKADSLTKQYGVNWWFVVTQSAYARSFGRYGLVLTRNQIDEWVREHLARA
jgi:hypothetical protein